MVHICNLLRSNNELKLHIPVDMQSLIQPPLTPSSMPLGNFLAVPLVLAYMAGDRELYSHGHSSLNQYPCEKRN